MLLLLWSDIFLSAGLELAHKLAELEGVRIHLQILLDVTKMCALGRTPISDIVMFYKHLVLKSQFKKSGSSGSKVVALPSEYT